MPAARRARFPTNTLVASSPRCITPRCRELAATAATALLLWSPDTPFEATSHKSGHHRFGDGMPVTLAVKDYSIPRPFSFRLFEEGISPSAFRP